MPAQSYEQPQQFSACLRAVTNVMKVFGGALFAGSAVLVGTVDAYGLMV
jgi:hypothetical protein